MAGYDFSFETSASYLEETRSWLKFFKLYAKTFGLKAAFQLTPRRTTSQVHAYVTVDGALPAMQALLKRLPDHLVGYVLTRPNPMQVARRVVAPSIVANEDGVARITETIFGVVGQLSSRLGNGFKVPPLALSPKLLALSEMVRPSKGAKRAIRDISRLPDAMLSGKLTTEQVLIAADQAVESWLKANMQVPATTKRDFPVLLTDALTAGLVDKRDVFRLTRFHRWRNRAQHKGEHIARRTVANFLVFIIEMMNTRAA